MAYSQTLADKSKTPPTLILHLLEQAHKHIVDYHKEEGRKRQPA